MNLKEAFRFQNKLQGLMESAQEILRTESNIVRTEHTYYHKKVVPELENEIIADEPASEFAGQITEMARFLVYLMGERERLSKAIRKAKASLPIDMDSEISLNSKRQELVRVFSGMADLRGREFTVKSGGVGFCFNQAGDQVSYRCDIRTVRTINFDRKVVRNFAAEINRRADVISGEIDKCLVNSCVSYRVPFSVNASFADAFETYLEKGAA